MIALCRFICYNMCMSKQMTKSDIAAAKATAGTLRVSRRSLMFFIRTILLVLAIGLICILAFLSAARLSNTYIMVNEGMTLRAASMLRGGGDDPDLAIYFTGDCVRADAALRARSLAPYADYTITSYEYDLTIEKLHVFPWQTDLYADVIEQVTSIKALVPANSGLGPVPAWTPIRYRLTLSRIDGRWYISAIDLIELNPQLPPANTPDPNRSPIPMATPTPEVTPITFTIR